MTSVSSLTVAAAMLVACVFSPSPGSCARLLVKRQTSDGTNASVPLRISDIVQLLGPRNEVDLIAVLQRSQGMGKRNFYTGIRPLMEALMVQYATIHPRYVRSAVVTFSNNATVAYDHISSGSDSVTKCELFGGRDPIWNKVVFRNDLLVGTNIRAALQVSIDILTKGKLHRPNATQVIVVMTDGDFGIGEDPLPYLPTLQRDMRVVMFAAGLGSWFKPVSVAALASNVSYYGQLNPQWMTLVATNRSSVGSDVSPFWAPLSGDDTCSYFGSNCSDENSACLCDVDSGVSKCKCNAGFQVLQQSTATATTSAIQCQACPVNTYRENDPNDDLTCPPCSPGFGTEPSVNASTPLGVVPGGCQCQDGNCTSDPCDEANNPCTENEICSANVTSGQAVCSCRKGWTSATCSVNPDDCSTVTSGCLNGGTCYDKVGGVQCICPLGFLGARCEINLDNCIFDICVSNNTAICQGGNNDFRCVCHYGWIGDFCENLDPNTTPRTLSSSNSSSIASPTLTSSASGSSLPPSSVALTTVTMVHESDRNSSTASVSDAPATNDRDNTNLIIIIVCVVGGALLILLLILVIVIATSRRRNRRREEEEKKANAAGRSDSFQTPNRLGVRSTGAPYGRTISNQFSGLWKKWTVRAHDPSDWYNAGAPSVPKSRTGLDKVSDPHSVDVDEAVVKNEEIVVDGRLSGWSTYLQELKKSGAIEDAIIAETDAHEFAKTSTWSVDWLELEAVEKALSTRKTDQTIRVQGTTFRIHSNDGTFATGFSENAAIEYSDYASCSSYTTSSPPGKTLSIAATKCYLIVGVACQDSDHLQKDMQWIVDHISAEGY